jgi:hypothetical protein
VGQFNGGIVASPVHYASVTKTVTYPFSNTTALKSQLSSPKTSGNPPLTALSVEFVAKPEEARHVEAAIPAAISGALKDVTGFAGCLVMISNQEARLVTVVTLWAGSDRAKCCSQNVRWVRALLKPYLDRCLRVQTMIAHLPVLSELPYLPKIQPGTNDADERFTIPDPVLAVETVCVA